MGNVGPNTRSSKCGGLSRICAGCLDYYRLGLMVACDLWFCSLQHCRFGLPETARNVVGAGSQKTTTWGWIIWDLMRRIHSNSKQNADIGNGRLEIAKGNFENRKTERKMEKKRFSLASGLPALQILFWRDSSLALWMAGSPYTVWYCVHASMPMIFKGVSRFNEFQIGLSDLPGGAGTVIGGCAVGKWIDWDCRKTAESVEHTTDCISGTMWQPRWLPNWKDKGVEWMVATTSLYLDPGWLWMVSSSTFPWIHLVDSTIFACRSVYVLFSGVKLTCSWKVLLQAA